MINGVSPPTLPASSSPQLLTVTGTNFKLPGDPNASSLIFYDTANHASPRTPINVTATSMQYNLTVGASTGVWKVTVVNGDVESLPFFFSVAPAGAGLPAPSSLSTVAVSPNQVNLTWVDQSSNESGFRVERLDPSGSWSEIATRDANVTSYSDQGCLPSTFYQYRVRAYNAAGSSAYSNTGSATTPALQSAGTTQTLTIRSINPSSGLGVSSYIYIDSSQYAQGATPTARLFARGSLVGVNCFPATLASGLVFQEWLLDGVDYAYTPNTLIVLDADHILTAVYGAAPLPARTLSSLTILGPDSVNERSSAQYTAVATYTDGSSADVVADWNEDSSYATISNAGRLDASAVTSNKYVEIDATYSAGGVTRTAIADVTIVNTDAVPNYTLNLSATHGQIGQRPNMNEYPADTVVQLFSYPDDGYFFDHWSGDASGTDGSLYVTMNANKSITANFAINTTDHGIQMFLSPQTAVDEGAGWQLFGASSWWNSGFTAWLSTSQTQTVFFKPIPGWVTPDSIRVPVPGGPATVAYATYQEIKGSLQVTLTPDAARTAGARWRLDGGAWTESGVTMSDVSTGSHTVEFLPLSGWGTPQSQSISVQRNVTSILYGDYFPPAGLPIITAVSPRTGPLAGGVTVTIEGANFAPGASVTFGGVSSTSVTFVNSTQILAVSPPRASYGTVPLSVQSGGQTAMLANGFSYLNALGANMDLVGQIGGDVDAVAVVGNMVYYGEGSGLVVSDFTNTASPVERGRIALPALVNGIAVVNNIAFVAAGTAGLYAVDVSVPTAPAIVGLFDTDGYAMGVRILGSFAYVADVFGLQILDVSDPAAIVALGYLSTVGRAVRVSVGTIATRTYAFLAADLGRPGDLALHVVDVTAPNAPVEVASVPAESTAGIKDAKVVGTTLYVSDWVAGVRIFDASDPTHLLQTTTVGNVGPSVIDVSGTRLYAWGSWLKVYDLTTAPNPSWLGEFDGGPTCYDLVVTNGLAFAATGRDGLKVVDINNPASMSLRSSIATIGSAQDVYIVGNTALVGNNTGLQTVDISNPAKPAWLASLPGAPVTHIVAANGKATIANYGDTTVRIADVANPLAPQAVGTYTGLDGGDVALMGTTPVLAGATTGATLLPKIDILDISSPSAPKSAGSVLLGNLSGIADAITIAGTWGFVGSMGLGSNTQNTVEVVNLANPALPQRTGTVPIAGFLRDIAASEDGEYVYAPSSLGIQVIDARIKTAPVVTTIVNPPQAAGSGVDQVQVLSNRLYADKGGDLFAFDITNPASPTVLGYYQVPSSRVNGIAAVNDLIFLANDSAGVTILRLKDLDRPTVAITSPTTNPAYLTTNGTVTLKGVATDNVSVARVVWDNDRGGGGVATGTTSWTIPDVQLAAGLNRVTVTAEDADGNLGTDVIEITANFPDVTPPVIAITGPKPDSQFTVDTPTINLVGSAADDRAVTTVTWINNRGGSGTATFADGVWSVTNLALDVGPNLVQVTATDSSGNSATASAVVFMLPPDTEAPSITIDFPTADALLDTADDVINLSGSASDNVGVNRIEWSNSSGGSGLAQGVSPWSVNGITLQPGLNVIEVTAYDDAGNSAVDALSVTYNTPTETPSPTPTETPSWTPTNTPTATATNTQTAAATNTPTATPSQTATETSIPTSTPTNTSTATPTWTASPTSTLTRTPTPSYTATPSPTWTTTAALTATNTPLPTFTNTPPPTPTGTGICTAPSFGAQRNFRVGSSPNSVAVGDFDGDGHPDLAVVNVGDNTVSVLLGTGTGSFGTPTNFGVGSFPISVAVGDFNGDGYPDLAVANVNDNTVSILLGSGTGSFAAATNFIVGSGPFSVAVGDFNGDGHPDLAVANNGDGTVSILLGTGAGSFAAATNFAAGRSPVSVAVGDFNGDGHPDLAVANAGDGTVSILLGTGAGSFAAATNFSAGGNPYSVAVGDFNGDGHPDIAVATGDDVSILLGTGTGSFGAETNFGAGSSPISVAVGDFNGDGYPDLAVANNGDGTVSVLLGTGTGSFGVPTNVRVGSYLDFVVVGDFNGDGRPDLAVANAGYGTVTVLLNYGCAMAPPCVVGTGTSASCTESALNACLPGGGSFTGTVTFNCGGAAPITVTSTKTISADTIIDGGSLITISGGNSVGVFFVNTGVTFTVQNLTIAHGNSASKGGGILTFGTLTVTNSTLSDNSGSAIYSAGKLTVSNSSFSGNSGGGSQGGAISSSGMLTVTNSMFSDNDAKGSYGGGIYSYSLDGITGGGTPEVTNSTFSGNSANGGGAISSNGTLTVTNSTFSGNSASEGGAIQSYGILTVTNSTCSGNSAADGGCISGHDAYLGTTTLTNTIVANSTLGGNCYGSVSDGGHNIDDGMTCGFTGTGCTNTSGSSFCSTNPQLDPAGLANNGGSTQTLALCGGPGIPNASCTSSTASPAINAGNESVCSMTTGTAPVDNLDQRGFIRPGTGDTNCSIGAFEANLPTPAACTGDCDGSGDVTVNEIITLVNMALGIQAQLSACPHGLPAGITDVSQVNVSLIIQAVNNALNGCA